MTYTVKASELLWDKLYPIYEKVMIPAASDALYELGSEKRTHLYFFSSQQFRQYLMLGKSQSNPTQRQALSGEKR